MQGKQLVARSAYPGLTLIELLIVMSILVLLVGATIPVLSPPRDERRLREAARGVNTFIAGAQARAVQTGRPFGVMLKRLAEATGSADDAAICVELVYAEEKPPFAGIEDSSRVMLAPAGVASAGGASAGGASAGGAAAYTVQFVAATGGLQRLGGLPAGWRPDLVPPGLLRPGDVIEISGAGYRLDGTLGASAGNTPLDEQGFFNPPANPAEPVRILAVAVDGATPGPPPAFDADGDRLSDPQPEATPNTLPPYRTEPLRYKVRRLPAVTSAPPYQLPEGTAIDLRASGTDSVWFHRDEEPLDDKIASALPVIVMFAPDSTVSRVYAGVDLPANDGIDNADVSVATVPDGGVYVLVGNVESVRPPGESQAEVDQQLDADPLADFAGTASEVERAKAGFNWLNGDSQWVVIGGATGSITTSPNGFVNTQLINTQAGGLDLPDRRDLEIRTARDFALRRVKEGGL